MNCFDLEKQLLGPLDKNLLEEDRRDNRGRSARGSASSCVTEDDDAMGFQILRSWRSQLVQNKNEVVQALGCVVKGLKAFGLGKKLGQKPIFLMKGFSVQARVGVGRLVLKPNDKRVILVNSGLGLGSLAFADSGLGTPSNSDEDPGSFMGPDVGSKVSPVVVANGCVALDSDTGGFRYDGFASPWLQLSIHY